jgi:hypothetical protein
MAKFNNVVVRAALYVDDVQSNNNFTSIVTGRTPAMWKGAQVEFQFALFKSKGTNDTDPELYDITEFTGLPKLRIRTTNAAGAILVDETSATSVEKDATLDLDSWNDGSKWHFKFLFPESATGITAGTQYIVVYGPDGDVFGRSSIEVIDAGTGAGASPAVGDETYYTKTDVNGLLQDKLDKQLADDQGLSFVALNQTTGTRYRISWMPVADDQGARMVEHVEVLT